jgi:hypothetical protein
MESQYIKAIEQRLEWLTWAQDYGHEIWGKIGDQYPEVLPMYKRTLGHGDTFFMNGKFCDLVDHARKDVPMDLAFDSRWLQAPDGWMWLGKPFTVPTAIVADAEDRTDPLSQHMKEFHAKEGWDVVVSAVGWYHLPPGSKTREGREVNAGATEFMFFQDFRHYNPKAVGFGCWSYFILEDGQKLGPRLKQFEDKARKQGGAYLGSEEMHEIRWLYAALYLMSQRLSVSVRHDTDRHTRRRAERAGRVVPPFIRVITLRRLEMDRKKVGPTVPVDWQWQWEVRGHWRNQFFKSTGEHRPVFVESYIKGPEDKPLKPPGLKVFGAVR